MVATLDQTRPDHDSILKSVKKFLKKIDRFHILTGCKRYIDSYNWCHDHMRFNLFGSISSGKMPYILRRREAEVGLFSCFITILGGIAYADSEGFIPVVDMKNYPNTYLYPDEVGHVNAWEYYFEQPGGISLEDALSCRKYILSKNTIYYSRIRQTAEAFSNKDGCLDYWRAICRKYIRFKPAVIERLERMKAKYFGRKILGLLVRGTDYTYLKPSQHPIPPTAEQAIAKAHEAMRERDFDSVYLATEDKKIVAKFQKAFGDKLILPEADYVDYDYDNPRVLASIDVKRENDKYLRGLEYLVSMLFLSHCAGFITSGTSGSAGVMCLSEGFEYLYFFNLGFYP